nr:hypothetical protein [Tanacetum cinerariifolium]
MGDLDIDTLMLKQSLALTRGNQALGVVPFLGSKNDDAYEHVERILDITNHLQGQTTPRIFPKMPSFKGIARPLKLSTSRGSNDSSDGIAAITNKLDSLDRDMKKLKENVHAIQVGCKNYRGAYLNKECPPGYYTRVDNCPPFGDKKPSLEELMNKPFLATIHAIIDVFDKDISLGVREDRIVFDMNGNVHHLGLLVEKVCIINKVQEESFNPLEIGDDLFSYDSSLCLKVERINHICETNQNSEDTLVYDNMQEQYEGEKGMTTMVESETTTSRLHYCRARTSSNRKRISRVQAGRRLVLSLILVSLRKEYDSFVQNYNMHDMGKIVIELHAILKLHEQTIPKKDVTPSLHTITAGKELSGSRKLKPRSLNLYVGDGHRVAVEAIGSFHLCLHSGLVLVLHNFHYAPSITKGIILVSRLSMYAISNKRAKTNLDSTLLWQCRLEHISGKRIKKLQHDGLLNSTENQSFDKCVSCMSGKMARKPFSHQVERAKDLLRLIHTDFLDHLKEHGIIAHHTPPYTLQHSGMFERRNKTLLYMICFMMSQTTLPNSFWDYVLESVARILNMVPTKKVEKTPYESLELLSVSSKDTKMKQCVILSTTHLRTRKWLFKKKTDMDGAVHTNKARLIAKGFTQTYRVDYEETFSLVADIRAIRILIAVAAFYGYEIWQMDVKTAFLNGHISERSLYDLGEAPYILGIKIYRDRSRRLFGLCQSAYIENILKRFYMENSKRGSIPMQERLKLFKSQGASTPAENVSSQFQQNPGDIHWTAVKNILKVSCYTDAGYLTDVDDLKSQTGYVFVLNGGVIDWKSTKQSIFATLSAEAEYIATYDALKKAVWIRKFITGLVVVPTIEEPTKIKWLFKKKTDMDGAVHTNKARLIAKGFTQTYRVDYEETFSLVADIRAIRILIAVAAFYGYEIWQMDVKTAFLNGHISERSLYDLGEAPYILGIKIYRDRSRRLFGLCQSAYIENILKRFYMENSKRGSIPMQERLKLFKSQGASTPAENVSSQFQQNPGDIHWTAVKNILKVSCYTDAGYLTDVDDLKSQTGYVFVLNGGVIDWKSTKQSIFATLSAEAEYIATYDALKKAVWIRKFITGLVVVPTIEEPTKMYYDNTEAITIANE